VTGEQLFRAAVSAGDPLRTNQPVVDGIPQPGLFLVAVLGTIPVASNSFGA